MYGALARPSSVPTRSGRSRRPFQPCLPSGRGHSVWSQYSSERLSCLARAGRASAASSGSSIEVAEPVVVLRPVHQADVAVGRAIHQLRLVEDASIGPQVQSLGDRADRVETDLPRFQRDRVGHIEGKQVARPARRQFRHVVAPDLVPRRLGHAVVLAVLVIDGEAIGERLVIIRVGVEQGVELLRVLARFRPGDVLGAGVKDQLPHFRGVDEIGRFEDGPQAIRRPDFHRAHAIAIGHRVDDPIWLQQLRCAGRSGQPRAFPGGRRRRRAARGTVATRYRCRD